MKFLDITKEYTHSVRDEKDSAPELICKMSLLHA